MCLDKCTPGYYEKNDTVPFVCIKCDDSCKECDDAGPTHCTKCFGWGSNGNAHSWLNEGSCYPSCNPFMKLARGGGNNECSDTCWSTSQANVTDYRYCAGCPANCDKC